MESRITLVVVQVLLWRPSRAYCDPVVLLEQTAQSIDIYALDNA